MALRAGLSLAFFMIATGRFFGFLGHVRATASQSARADFWIEHRWDNVSAD
jgi:hypothetical protein